MLEQLQHIRALLRIWYRSEISLHIVNHVLQAGGGGDDTGYLRVTQYVFQVKLAPAAAAQLLGKRG